MDGALPRSVATTIGASQPPTPTTKPAPSRTPTAFISGHMEITPQEFTQHYEPRLHDALALGHHFVIGDAKGVDASALAYLLAQEHNYPDVQQRITVHVSRPGQLGRYQAMGVRTVCTTERYDKRDPRARHLNRDAGMTQASDYDILWARTEREEKAMYGGKWRPRVSATELNRLRRLEMDERADGEGVGGWG